MSGRAERIEAVGARDCGEETDEMRFWGGEGGTVEATRQ